MDVFRREPGVLRRAVSVSAVLLAGTACAVLVGNPTDAGAVDQDPKNGCSSPETYSGALQSPSFVTGSTGNSVGFQAWFEIEAVDPAGRDEITLEYSINGGETWAPLGRLNPTSPETGSSDQSYSNNGLGASPTFGARSFPLPSEAASQSDVRFRVMFDTGDTIFQGFRGVAIDAVTVTAGGEPVLAEGFEGEAPGWSFTPPRSPGAPFWHILANPQQISVKSPEINPELVTLPDAGALPPAFAGTHVAWFGDDATGTYCGPDYANRAQLPPTGTPPSVTVPTQTQTPPRPDPTPRLGVSVVAEVLRGSASVGIPSRAAKAGSRARASQKGVKFVPLTEAREVPVGSFLDTRRGEVSVESASNALGNTQAGAFASGLFQVLQSRRRPLTTLRLKGSSFRRCSRARGRRRARRSVQTAARRRLSRRTVRRLRGNATGQFRTRGRYSAATVRGTVWSTTDRCDGTLTKVNRGRVVVRDFRRRRNVVVKAGKSYLAKPRR